MFAKARNDPQCKVVVLAARGPVFWCADCAIGHCASVRADRARGSAGADLGELIPLRTGAREPRSAAERAVAADFERALGTALLRSVDVGKPVIAAVAGHAYAGGFELVLNTDLRVACRAVRFALPEVSRGLLPAGGGVARAVRTFAPAVALELLLSGAPVDAERMHQLGFLNALVDTPADVLPAAMTLAQRIAANAPTAVLQTRRAARACIGRTDRCVYVGASKCAACDSLLLPATRC